MTKGKQTDEADGEETMGSVRVVSGSGFRYVVPFPWRLHQMLDAIEEDGDTSIVSWLSDECHFQVHNPQAFVEKVIPKFFKQKSYKSFQRQLHLYGFHRETDGPHRGGYHHEKFVRSNRQLALEISRIKAPKRRRQPAKNTSPSKVDSASVLGSANASPLTRFQPLHAASSQTPFIAGAEHSDTQVGIQSCSSMPQSAPSNPIGSISDASTVAETCNWLIDAGVPVSAFDPVSVNTRIRASSDLMDCAAEITEMFSLPGLTSKEEAAPTMNLLLDSPAVDDPTFGVNSEDASLQLPEAMLGELNDAIWGLTA